MKMDSLEESLDSLLLTPFGMAQMTLVVVVAVHIQSKVLKLTEEVQPKIPCRQKTHL